MSDAGARATRGDPYRRWQLDSFDQGHTTDASKAQVRLPTAEQIAQIERNAHEAGYAAGLEEGRAAGYAEGRLDAEAEATRLRVLAGAFSDALERMDRDIGRDLVDLALGVARQLVRETLPVRHDLVLALVRESIATMPPFTRPAQLVLNPDDVAVVREHLQSQLAELGWTMVGDPRVERGGCRVESSLADLDATLGTRWERIAQALASDRSWLDGERR
jgi:flagellar assembly protein FliH